MHRIFKMMCCIAAFFSLNQLQAAEKIELATLEWPPYVGEDLNEKGYVTAVINAAFEAAGREKPEVTLTSWKRAITITKQGKASGVYPMYFTDKRDKALLMSDPIPGGPIALMKLKSNNASWDGTIDSLKPYKIGVIAGYSNTKEFDEADYLKKSEANNDLNNLKKLLAGRVDLAIIDPLVAENLLSKEEFAKLEIIKPVLEPKSLYIGFSAKVQDAAQVCADFNKGLKLIKQNGVLDKILKQFDVFGKVDTASK